MFDNVGRNEDADSGRTRTVALLATLGLTSGVFALTLALLALTTVHSVVGDPIDTDLGPLVEVLLDGDDLDLGTLPPPPALLGKVDAVPRPPEVDPDPTEVSALPPDVATSVTPVVDNAGSEVGTADGTPDGEGDAVGPTTPGGDGDGAGGDGSGSGSGVVVLHHKDVTILKRVNPVYPRAAEDMHLGEVSCRVEVSIDETGRPYDVSTRECPAMFVESAEQALFQWRWRPATVAGRPTEARFLMVLKYIDEGN